MTVISPVSTRVNALWSASLAPIWHVCGSLFAVGIASWVGWNTPWFWQVAGNPGYGGLIGLCLAAYLGSASVSARISRFGRSEGFSVVGLSVLMAFAITLGALVFARWYYSRSFLGVAFTFALIWQLLGYRLLLARSSSFAVVPTGLGRELLALPNGRCHPLDSPTWPIKASAVAIDLHQPLPLDWQHFLAECALRDTPVYHAATVFEGLTGRVPLESLSEGTIETFNFEGLYPTLKRTFDILVVLAASPILVLLSGLVALIVRIDSSGPVLFLQMRMGRGGLPFQMVKFRSMRIDAEGAGQRFAIEGDDRITRVGRFIRKYRLDELPQFWNVLRGDMSVMGPRPEQVVFAERFTAQVPLYAYRHLVRPGITGWAQVMHGYTASLDETRTKLEHDLYYVKHLSLWLDLLIVYKSVKVILSGFGAR